VTILSESHKNQSKVHALTSATHDRQTRFCGFLRSGRRVCDWIVRCGRPLDLSLVILFSRRLEIFLRLTETTYIKEFSECDGGVVVGKQSKNVGWHSGVENAQAKGTTFQGAAGAFQSKQDTGADCDQPCAQNRESLFFCPGEMNKKKGKVKTHLALVASSLSLYLSVCPYTFFRLYTVNKSFWFPLELMLHVFFFLPFHYNKIKKRPENKTHSRGRPRGNVSVGIAPSEC
jgi:cellulose synthase/poly-beta-1,6-N-acetylglucosamine synthase-like glycosyltransferase